MRIAVYGKDQVMRRVRTALSANGDEVVDLVGGPQSTDDRQVNLAVVDVTAPGAAEICEYLKKTREVPIVVVLGFGEDGWRKVEEVNVDGYVHRTATQGEMAARFRALERRITRIAGGR